MIIGALFLLVLFILCLRVPHIGIAVFHIVHDVYYGVVDVFNYIRYRCWDVAPVGRMVCYSGLFGRGKTLSAVHEIKRLYERYNGRMVYDKDRRKWVKQRVYILSNVQFVGVPFRPLVSLAEVVSEAYSSRRLDMEQDTRTVILVLIDEASVQLNSRDFKRNISADFLNTILTCRHYYMSIYYTSQRFNLTDKLLRDVTQHVVECSKVWRFQAQYTYDAWTLENSSRPDEVRPLKRGGFFVCDRDYRAYDTLAVVDNLKKSTDTGDMLSDDEIISRRAATFGTGGNNINIKVGRRRLKVRSS